MDTDRTLVGDLPIMVTSATIHGNLTAMSPTAELARDIPSKGMWTVKSSENINSLAKELSVINGLISLQPRSIGRLMRRS